jgi:purine-binding chemotaxis protein CheW
MSVEILLFSTNDNYYALPVDKVIRALWALEITLVPKSPKILYGVFDLHGKMIPILSIRELLSMETKQMELDDALIILELHSHHVALLVDHIIGVHSLEEEDSSETTELFRELCTTHIVKYEDSLIPVLDIETLVDAELLSYISNKKS